MSEKPVWAGSCYGGYGHDWMDCPRCVQGYEIHLQAEGEIGPGAASGEILRRVLQSIDDSLDKLISLQVEYELLRSLAHIGLMVLNEDSEEDVS